jgi:hypothetical protein
MGACGYNNSEAVKDMIGLLVPIFLRGLGHLYFNVSFLLIFLISN